MPLSTVGTAEHCANIAALNAWRGASPDVEGDSSMSAVAVPRELQMFTDDAGRTQRVIPLFLLGARLTSLLK